MKGMERVEIEMFTSVRLDANGLPIEMAPMIAATCKTREDIPGAIAKLNNILDSEVARKLDKSLVIKSTTGVADKAFLEGLNNDNAKLVGDKVVSGAKNDRNDPFLMGLEL